MVTEIKQLSDKCEFVIPKSIREECGFEPKNKIRMTSTKHGMLVVPVKKSFKDIIGRLNSDLTTEELEEITQEILYS